MSQQYNLNSQSVNTPSSIDYKGNLNTQQYAAVTSAPGYALVIAGAGSGKTHTLTYRVAFLIEKAVDPGNILLLTFTNKASKEMLERVKNLLETDISALWGGTFHSICSRILRRHADEIGFDRNFSILDSDDQKSLMRRLIKDKNISIKERRFPKAEVILSILSLSTNKSISVEDIIDNHYLQYDEWREDICELAATYKANKQESNSMDFDDLLALVLALFETSPEIAKMYQKKFRHVLVDEYQDTNKLQGALIAHFANRNKSLMAVGDDAQSIYSWRGAEMQHILDFEKQFPDSTVYKIETNYRSTPEILELSNAAIKANSNQYEKDLQPVRDAGMTPAVVPLNDPSSQAEFICQKIEETVAMGIEPEEIAVLYRAHYHSMEIQLFLARQNLPFKITSGLRFFEQAHVKDVTAFVRFVSNPKDEVSFRRMIEMLPAIGPKSAEKLWLQWCNEPYFQKGTRPDSYSSIFIEYKVPAKAKVFWEQLVYTLDELLDQGREDGMAPPDSIIFSVMEGFYRDYAADAFENAEQRLQDLETLKGHAEDYIDIEAFLTDLSLISSVDDKKDEPKDQITLSTIHQAKGLEWKVVFVVFLNERMFPSNRVIETGDLQQLEEERRLYYVAITRAKDELYLTYPMSNPKSYTGDYYLEPSRFLSDCSPNLTEEWVVSSW